MILNADLLAAEITEQNDRLRHLCSMHRNWVAAPVKDFVTAGGPTDSLCRFEYADPELLLHCRVVLI
ncbi:unnamed protein product [marine sediment metagenome]|uniref:Uncharacterized protein n=1 Tax=marine sediment metagenome TaxID=412755 RepID=X1PG85_9ZZZZ